MRDIWTITKREFKLYFVSPIAYVYLVTFVILVNWLFWRGFFLIGEASLRPFFAIMPWIFLFFIPAVAMGKWAEERKSQTMEIILTLPVTEWSVITGKFLAGLFLILASILLTLPMTLSVGLLGSLDWGVVFCSYIGLIFLGAAYLSIGLFISSITENQIIAFIVGVVVSFVLLILGEPIFTNAIPSFFVPAFQYAGLSTHFGSISRGVVDSSDIIYYLSVIGFFNWLSFKSIESR